MILHAAMVKKTELNVLLLPLPVWRFVCRVC